MQKERVPKLTPVVQTSRKTSIRKGSLGDAVKDASYGWLGTLQDLALVALVTAVQLHRASFVYTSVGTIIDDAATLFDRL